MAEWDKGIPMDVPCPLLLAYHEARRARGVTAMTWTPEILSRVRAWCAEGYHPRWIAGELGCSLAALQKAMTKNRIPSADGRPMSGRRRVGSVRLGAALGATEWDDGADA